MAEKFSELMRKAMLQGLPKPTEPAGAPVFKPEYAGGVWVNDQNIGIGKIEDFTTVKIEPMDLDLIKKEELDKYIKLVDADSEMKKSLDLITTTLQRHKLATNRRWIHVDQSRYPGIVWELDAAGKPYEIRNGVRTPDENSSASDYLTKAATSWWVEVDEQYKPLNNDPHMRIKLDALGYLEGQKTFPPGQEGDPAQDVPQTEGDAW